MCLILRASNFLWSCPFAPPYSRAFPKSENRSLPAYDDLQFFRRLPAHLHTRLTPRAPRRHTRARARAHRRPHRPHHRGRRAAARVARGHAPRRSPRWTAERSERLLPLHPADFARCVVQARRLRAPPNSRLAGPVADAREDAVEPRHSRPPRARGLHGGKSFLREHAGILCHRQFVSPQGPHWQITRRVVPARALVAGALHRCRHERDLAGPRQWRRALRGQRAQSVAGALRDARAHGLRGVPLRHARLRGQHAAFVRAGASLRQATARDEQRGNLGLLQRPSRGAPAIRDGPAKPELDSRAGFSPRPAGRRCHARRLHRRERRRHADVRARRGGSARHRGVSRRDGFHRDAGRLHVREFVAAARGHRQRRVCRALRAQAARHDVRERLDESDGDERLSRLEVRLQNARRTKQRFAQAPAALRSQLQLREPLGDVCVAEQAPQTRPQGTRRGAGFQTPQCGGIIRVGRATSEATGRRGLRAQAHRVAH